MRIALVLGVVLGAGYLFVFPARTYLGQERQIAAEQQALAVLQAENAKLASESAALQKDSTIEEIARQDYGLVMPGEQAYMVLPSAAHRAPSAPKKPKSAPWYSSLEFWHHF